MMDPKPLVSSTPRRRTARTDAAGAKPEEATEELDSDQPLPEPSTERYVLRLYVTGVTRASANAVERVRALCEEQFSGRYELEIIDIYQLPALAKGEQIVATPTLIRVLPAPLRRYIGDMSSEKLIFGLDLRVKS